MRSRTRGRNIAPLGMVAPLLAVAPAGGWSQVEFTDLTPRFLEFYDSAMAVGAEPDRRWALWQHLYGFAAVPPTPAGRERARELLDAAWDRYADALPAIRAGAKAWPLSPQVVLDRVHAEMGCGAPPRVRVTAFVGAFDGTAFSWTWPPGVLNVAVPVEAGDAEASLVHELTHAVHAACSGGDLAHAQPPLRIVLAEGLAVHAVSALLPAGGTTRHLKADDAWLARCRTEGPRIVRALLDEPDVADPAVIERYTSGAGATGMPREAYCAGWLVVGWMLREEGRSLRALASLSPEAASAALRRAAEAYLSSATHGP